MRGYALAAVAAAGLLAAMAPFAGRVGTASSSDACVGCHAGLEHASPSHEGCTTCHGGNPSARDKDSAHAGIYGLANPSYAGRWEKGCAPCHLHQVERMKSSQMFTNAGMIAQIQATWEGERPGRTYGAVGLRTFAPDGRPIEQRPVGDLDHVSGDLYRKFCARCHVARQNEAMDGAGHGAGCAACHFPYAADATYRGGDRTMHGKSPYSRSHAMQGLPPIDACARCHHRSGRHALSFQGLMDGNNALVPTRDGGPGPLPGSDDRSFSHIAPDVHFAAGMECIDCHTSREIMGDGYAAADMHGQLEIACRDCHGDGERPPAFATVSRENDAPLRESRQYGRPLTPGTRVALTSKGRPFSNVVELEGRTFVATKRTGRLLESPVVTGSAAHRVAGHERMACAACHSRTVVQCYGCHTSYDKRRGGWDFVQGRETPGEFNETEDYRTLYPFPLALDGEGRVAPVTPGCQTFVTVVEPDGTVSQDEAVAVYRGKRQLRFAPFFGHNTGPRAVGCAECHGNPSFLGFGQHVVERGRIKSTLVCPRNDAKPLDGFLAMEGDRVVAHSAVSRAGARPLTHDEVRKVFAVNLCLICHEEARDPIYRRPIDHAALDDSLHRRLLAAGR